MGRTPCSDSKSLKKGPWSPEEDEILVNYINKHGHGSWPSLPKLAVKFLDRQAFFVAARVAGFDGRIILGRTENAVPSPLRKRTLSFSFMASLETGRTDNEIKNLWNTHLKKRLLCIGLDPKTHETTAATTSPATRHMTQWESAAGLETEARISEDSSLFNPNSDYFLCLWNSEVGESFRNMNKEDKTICQIPILQTSSSTKLGSVSAVTVDSCPNIAASNQVEDIECKSFNSCTEDPIDAPNTSCSNKSEYSSDTALKSLLDFPVNNDMSFLENLDPQTYLTPSPSEEYL